jgi:hypothetical protein
MNSRFKRLTSASAVALGLACAGGSAGAAVLGGAGEALLVPLAVWSSGVITPAQPPFTVPSITPAVDTIIEVIVPGSVGFDDIPNIYTAANTTPTNIPTALTPADPDLSGPDAAIHWYWFDNRSVERASGSIPVTPNDVVQISLTEALNGQFQNQPGYMVIANESARSGDSAVFSMFGNAWLTGALNIDGLLAGTGGIGFPLIGHTIPVLGMNDAADGPNPPGTNCGQPSLSDSVKYRGGSPCAVSPVVAGFRTNRSDGDFDLWAMDLALSNRLLPTIHVIWIDQNLDNASAINAAYPGNTALPNPNASFDTFDLDELSCNGTVTLPNELNVLWIPPAYLTPEQFAVVPFYQPFAWTTQSELLCVVSDANPAALISAGFVQYRLDEYIDTNVGRAESSAFAFSIKVDGGFVSNDPLPIPDTFFALLESSLGHDLGTFKSF